MNGEEVKECEPIAVMSQKATDTWTITIEKHSQAKT